MEAIQTRRPGQRKDAETKGEENERDDEENGEVDGRERVC